MAAIIMSTTCIFRPDHDDSRMRSRHWNRGGNASFPESPEFPLAVIGVFRFPVLALLLVGSPRRRLFARENQRLQRFIPLQPSGDAFRGVLPAVAFVGG